MTGTDDKIRAFIDECFVLLGFGSEQHPNDALPLARQI